jgi:hypothetical protein
MRNYNLTEAEVRIIMLLRRAISDSQHKRDRRIITIEVESLQVATGLSVMRPELPENSCYVVPALVE